MFKPKRIYFIAICGTAMASLASMLKAKGHTVYGSDENIYPPMSTFLRNQGINILEGFHAAHLKPAPDLVVIGNAMSRGNPEVEFVLENKIPYQSLSVVLKENFIQGKTSFVISGTHGKTTISSLLAWVLEKNNLHPGFLIGGIPENFGTGAKNGSGDVFVVEGDEYDTAFFDKGPKFLHYLPDALILNNIEFDHADIYNSLDEITLNFRRLINLVPRNGVLIANNDDKNVRQLLEFAFCPALTFGMSPSATFQISNIRTSEEETTFQLAKNKQYLSDFTIPLFGEYNVRNATAAFIAANWYGLSNEQIQAAFSTFKGIRRRLSLRADINQIQIYDDFAHHPTAIKETISGMRARFPERRIWAIYEPRTSTAKRNMLYQDYLQAFEKANFTIFAPIHRPDKIPSDSLINIAQLVQELSNNQPAWHFKSTTKILEFLKEQLLPGDVVLIMSNGAFDNIHDKLIEILKG